MFGTLNVEGQQLFRLQCLENDMIFTLYDAQAANSIYGN